MTSATHLVTEGEAAGPAPQVAGSRKQAVKAVLTKPTVIICLAFLAFISLLAIFAPLIVKISGYGPYTFDGSAIDPALGGLPRGPLGGVSSDHWFGVEPQTGRDIFARIAYGARVSLLIALSATAITTFVGVSLGMIGGFLGGWADQVISRLMDFLMAFPSLIFMIAIMSVLPEGNRPLLLILILSIFGWPYIARVIRAQSMSIRGREYSEAAIASGAGRFRIIRSEVLPNLVGTIIVMATLSVPLYISTEAGLSFLGVGITPPQASWGQMIAQSVGWYTVDPMYFLIPGTFLFLTVLTFMVVGDNLQEALDPRGGAK